jgi:exopolyphosphatase/guanosine-5'-triphosphate,3'-diphosphate pyrophosphatase
MAEIIEVTVLQELIRPRSKSIARGRLDDRRPVSVIDIGSNSVRLVVYEGATRSPTPLFNEKVLCGLGRVVAKRGKIEGESAMRTLEALARFKFLSSQLGAGTPWIVATAAVRDASNGKEFVADIERICEAKVLLLSGKREAELAASGIMSGFYEPDGFVGDLGGGSLELVDLAEGAARQSITLPLGGLTLSERTQGQLGRAAGLIDRDFDTVPWMKKGSSRPFYAVGGTWRTIAKLHMEETAYPLHITHGYAISAATAREFCEMLAKGKRLRNANQSEVSSARREVIPFGAAVLDRLVERLAPSEVIFSVHGIREGLLYALLPQEERKRDPLLAFCQDYATLRSRSPVHGQELCDWTDRLFATPGPAETVTDRRLRHAACLLSDIGWRAHPDYRGEQSLDLIARASLSGVDHPGRAFIALAVCYRHIGDNSPGGPIADRVLELIDKKGTKRARLVGAAIRAAHMLSAGAAGVIPRTPAQYINGKLVLSIPPDLAMLQGERLKRRFTALAELTGRQAEIRVAKT